MPKTTRAWWFIAAFVPTAALVTLPSIAIEPNKPQPRVEINL